MTNSNRDFILNMMSTVLEGHKIKFDDALKLIRSDDVNTLAACAKELTQRFVGNHIDVETLINAKSGTCPEDCSFCAQSSFNSTIIEKYPLLPPEKILEQAENALKNGANSFCIVCAYRAPPEKDFRQICETIKLIRKNLDIEVNASLGFMTMQRAKELKSLGVKRYNHNLETAKSYFDKICNTHSYQDRIDTAKIIKNAGLELCCGGIIGMGESVEQRVELGMALASLNPDEVPINVLIGREGTPLHGQNFITKKEILQTVATFRFLMPKTILKIAGGREVHLKGDDKKILQAGANGIITGGYLTTQGNKPIDDFKMLEEIGARQK
ncbi:biotin synthase BioB [Candidatus Nitrosocosmicus franklandus]|uniref:Biotin synthase n=1 Tax=Candidatus Nitrosocosmicus franklandianus TaxID=1798806 RepID=A0A484IIJ1_9ARCH|nr:biotin synthase BioB [Candidatus Nitrosocosmicus franklandus]VFJ15475.1 Biotin synthase [Candidatus Nitrosocosmicus franklandus]